MDNDGAGEKLKKVVMELQVTPGNIGVHVVFEDGTPVRASWDHMLGIQRAVMKAWLDAPIFEGVPHMTVAYRPSVVGDNLFTIMFTVVGGFDVTRVRGFLAEVGRAMDAYAMAMSADGMKVAVNRNDVQ